jgi:hypothetical protein
VVGVWFEALGASDSDPQSDIILCGTVAQSSGRSTEILQQPCYGGVVLPGQFQDRLHHDHGNLDAHPSPRASSCPTYQRVYVGFLL